MGRTKQYNETEVLNKALHTFWKHGYEKTTVRQLESDMGINQFSIYATFKDKENLYKRVLKSYQEKIRSEFLVDLEKDNCNLNDVQVFLTRFALSIAQGNIPNSCMMVNSALELELLDRDLRKVVIGFFDSTKTHFSRAIVNEMALGTMNTEISVDESAEYLVGVAQSVSVYSKMRTPDQIRNYISFAVNLIKKK